MPFAPVLQALLAILLIATGWLAPPSAAAQALLPVPPLSARVIDPTGILSATERQALDTRLAGIEQRHGSQVVVLMVQTTSPEDIAAYANRVANQWKIGRRDVGDGVIVLVAQQDRKMRIEVAKALEGALPDIAAARIIDSAMKPRFQQNDFAGGLTAAVNQIEARIAGEGLPVPGDTHQRSGKAQPGDGFDWTDLAVFLFFGVMVGGPLARRIFGKGLGGLLVGGGAGGLALLVTSSLLIAGGVTVLALLYTWLFGGRTGTVWHGGGGGGAAGGLGGWAGGGGMGGWGGGFGSGGSGGGGGGFSSGGGGDFGGGGASGDW